MCHSSCGGSARIATETAFELARRRHRVTLFTRTPSFFCAHSSNGVKMRTLADDENNGSVSELDIDWPADDIEAMIRMVGSTIAENGLDVLHVHYALPFAFIAKQVKIRVGAGMPVLVVTLHGTDVSVYARDSLIGPALQQYLKCFDAVTTVSENYARLAEKVLNLESTPEVIPGFVNLDHFSPKACPLNHERPKILHISNFRSVKNPKAVAHIFQAIRKRIDAELWLVGDGPEMKKVKELLGKHLIGEHVKFFGFQKNVAPIIRRSHLLLMPSQSESFCLAALESMACGVPVLASHSGGIEEVIVDKKTGFLFPPGDHEAVADRATHLLEDPASYEIVSSHARRHAARFDLNAVVSQYENLYCRIVAEKERPIRNLSAA